MCSYSTDAHDMPRCQEILAEMVHTKDGSRVVRELLARGNAKVSNSSAPPLVPSSQPPYQGPKTNTQSIKTTHQTHVSRR